MINVKRTDIKIKAKPERVIPLFLDLKKKNRVSHIVDKIVSLDDKVIENTLNHILEEFESRHIKFKDVLLEHYKNIETFVPSPEIQSLQRKLLLGSYFTKEYSIESAAIFNPSIVVHYNQKGLKNGEVRFIISLRATGEGHISSIEFRTGVITKEGKITMDTIPSNLVYASKINEKSYFFKDFVIKRAQYYKGFNSSIFEYFPEKFTKQQALEIIAKINNNYHQKNIYVTKKALLDIFDTNYEIFFDKNIDINSRVIFPKSKAESNGMEDLRLVKFIDKDKIRYIGTYTAYDGKNIRPQIIETEDFINFKIHSLYGNAAFDKGMSLFPEKINGKYAMIGRQGGENISIMYSDNLYFWDTYKTIQRPQFEWDSVQLGNSGSPVKTKYGWLLLTHAVGPLRKYVMSASLLDLHNPEIVLSSLNKPFFSANGHEREGYVPNVVYTCGFLQHYNNLIIPYALSDTSFSFAIADIDNVLNELQKHLCYVKY
ncbi:MAG: glycoside hydrolase family 130 protein [Bacteroidales bacterium]|nr:glycoside hydrolase family 130 protein [Bacteroidales bacterium]